MHRYLIKVHVFSFTLLVSQVHGRYMLMSVHLIFEVLFIRHFFHNSYIQDETFYIGRMLKELCCYSLLLALTLKFLTTYGTINSVYHSDKI